MKPSMEDRVFSFLSEHNFESREKVAAIKAVRNRFETSLYDAKAMTEKWLDDRKMSRFRCTPVGWQLWLQENGDRSAEMRNVETLRDAFRRSKTACHKISLSEGVGAVKTWLALEEVIAGADSDGSKYPEWE